MLLLLTAAHCAAKVGMCAAAHWSKGRDLPLLLACLCCPADLHVSVHPFGRRIRDLNDEINKVRPASALKKSCR